MSVKCELKNCDLRTVYGLPACGSDQNMTGPNYNFCYVHKRYIDSLKESFKCDDMNRLNPMCGSNFTMSYFEIAPYTHEVSEGKLEGVMLSKHFKV